jgi:hypothetical protein
MFRKAVYDSLVKVVQNDTRRIRLNDFAVMSGELTFQSCCPATCTKRSTCAASRCLPALITATGINADVEAKAPGPEYFHLGRSF